MNQFSDRPFAIGSMFGIRSFKVDNGKLTGVVHTCAWQDGVNEAICDDTFTRWAETIRSIGISAAEASWNMTQTMAALNGKVSLRKRPVPPPVPVPAPKRRPPHPIGSLDCTCGFYAYFDRGHNPHHKEGQILGIVEGFGVMTVGSRGFRCSKARIRALIDEDGLASLLDPRYGDIPRFASIDAALAEFPLTVPEGTPEPSPEAFWESATRTVTFTMTVDTSGWSRIFANMQRDLDRIMGEETPQQRALRLRRERNTGPQDSRGLDGRSRRHGT
jgi:hypothetical protein